MPRATPDTISPNAIKPEGRVRAAMRAWRDCGFLRKLAQMSLAWLGLAVLSAGAQPWSGKDIA